MRRGISRNVTNELAVSHGEPQIKWPNRLGHGAPTRILSDSSPHRHLGLPCRHCKSVVL